MNEIANLLACGLQFANKLACLGIVLGAVWYLQRFVSDEEEGARYPVLRSLMFRVFVSLVGAGFAIDLFSIYAPALSEVVMNLGIFGLVAMFYTAYNKRAAAAAGKKENVS